MKTVLKDRDVQWTSFMLALQIVVALDGGLRWAWLSPFVIGFFAAMLLVDISEARSKKDA